MKPWENIITEQDLAVYRAAGFGRVSGMGVRPALLVIDTQYRTVGSSPLPILESLNEYPTSCGEIGWEAITNIAKLISVFRKLQLPIIYPHVAQKTRHDGGRFAEKVPAITAIPARGYDFVEEVAPMLEDILIPKYHPSAFFGTALTSHLINLQVDTVFVTGCTTSGCVRATVVDAFSLNYKVVVPKECVFDRSTVSHAVSLFDISSKYGDVLALDELIDDIQQDRDAAPGSIIGPKSGQVFNPIRAGKE
jgi:nicotinamidase-related amidase